jgi:uncharacterized protein YdeI (YjbR/CyaY-like superfamily)
MKEMKKIKKIYFKDSKEWRDWLDKNHIIENKVAVIRYKKHTGKPSPSHMELMHEAICFGWIDTTVKRIDDKKYLINFSRRSDKSRWSDNTLSYGKMLIEQGKMSVEGLKHYHAGLKRPSLDFGVPKNPKMPLDLKKELEKDKIAKENFDNFAPSYRRTYLRWIEKTKNKESREKRVNEVVKRARENRKNWL